MMVTRQMENKRAIYLAQKAKEKSEQIKLTTPDSDIKIHIDDNNNDSPKIPDEFNPDHPEFHPKDTQILSNGSVVMNTY